MGAERQARHDAEAASATLQRPEEVWVRAGVGELDAAVGGHDLGFQQVSRSQAESLGQDAEAAAED